MWVILLLLGAGIAVAHLLPPPEGTPAAIDWLVLHLALPAVVLSTLPDLDMGADVVVPVGTAWALLALSVGAVLAVARLRSWGQASTGTLLLVACLGNTSFFGFPAVAALLGEDHLPYAALYDQFGSFLMLAIWGAVVTARYGAGASPTVASIGIRVLRFPPFVAVLASFVLRVTGTPEVARETLEVIGASLVPLAITSIALRMRPPRRELLSEQLVVGLAIKMALAPALVLVALTTFGRADLAWHTSLLESAMPPMITAGVVATGAGLDEDLATAMVGYGLLAAFVTLPLWATVI